MRAASVVRHALAEVPPPLLAVAAGGWALLAVAQSVPSLPPMCGIAGSGDLQAVGWLAPMLLAMTPPLLAPALLHVWRRSLRRRRVRAAGVFLFGYAAVWCAAVASMMALLRVLDSLALAGLIALLWQATALKQISLDRCHRRPPLAAFGVRAETDAWRYGASQGTACVGACWGLMLVAMACPGPWQAIAMLCATFAAIAERHQLRPVPSRVAGWSGLKR